MAAPKYSEKFPDYLECRADDGRTEFYATLEVLVSPDLQERCVQQDELRRIKRELEQRGLSVDHLTAT